MDDQTAKQLLSEIRELKAMVAQLGPVPIGKPGVAQEIAACRAQGVDLATYFKSKGAAAARRSPKKARREKA
jgi:hypothetical protein